MTRSKRIGLYSAAAWLALSLPLMGQAGKPLSTDQSMVKQQLQRQVAQDVRSPDAARDDVANREDTTDVGANRDTDSPAVSDDANRDSPAGGAAAGGDTDTDTLPGMEQAREISMRFFQELWSTGDAALVDQLLSTDVTIHSNGVMFFAALAPEVTNPDAGAAAGAGGGDTAAGGAATDATANVSRNLSERINRALEDSSRLSETGMTKEDFQRSLAGLKEILTDVKFNVEEMLVSEDRVITRWSAEGMLKPQSSTPTSPEAGAGASADPNAPTSTDMKVRMEGIDIHRFEALKIAEIWSVVNLGEIIQMASQSASEPDAGTQPGAGSQPGAGGEQPVAGEQPRESAEPAEGT